MSATVDAPGVRTAGGDPAAMDRAARAEVLRAMGATPCETEELLLYNDNVFALPGPADPAVPLADEPFVAAWEAYAEDARARGVLPALRDRLPQLRFPIAEGMSATPAYLAATRRGVPPPAGAPALALEAPERLRLFLHWTAAGRIPVLVAEHRPDFVALLRALTRRNEPAPIPASQGAVMVGGYNNWDRVAGLRDAFERGEILNGQADDWAAAFAILRDRKELYQDRFIIIGGGPYSATPAEALRLGPEEWARLSVTIRLEHECAHYFTRRVLGSMRDRLLDELIADYAGIAAAAGRYRADWFLRFMGIGDGDGPDAGGRLENYRGTPPLSDGALRLLRALVRRAARHVEAVDGTLSAEQRGVPGRARMIVALAGATLEELAADDAPARLLRRLETAAAR